VRAICELNELQLHHMLLLRRLVVIHVCAICVLSQEANDQQEVHSKRGNSKHNLVGLGTQHAIKAGDNMGGIARQYGTTVQQMMEANPHIANADLIKSGSRLNVPSSIRSNFQLSNFQLGPQESSQFSNLVENGARGEQTLGERARLARRKVREDQWREDQRDRERRVRDASADARMHDLRSKAGAVPQPSLHDFSAMSNFGQRSVARCVHLTAGVPCTKRKCAVVLFVKSGFGLAVSLAKKDWRGIAGGAHGLVDSFPAARDATSNVLKRMDADFMEARTHEYFRCRLGGQNPEQASKSAALFIALPAAMFPTL
jgi:LysM repeat protein